METENKKKEILLLAPIFNCVQNIQHFHWFQVPERCHWRVARGQRGLLGRLVRRHQLVRHPRQACDHHAKGYSARQKNPWRTSLNPVSTVHCIPPSSTRTQTVSRRQTSSQNLHIFRPPFSTKEYYSLDFSDYRSASLLRNGSLPHCHQRLVESYRRRTEHHSSFRFFLIPRLYLKQ